MLLVISQNEIQQIVIDEIAKRTGRDPAVITPDVKFVQCDRKGKPIETKDHTTLVASIDI